MSFWQRLAQPAQALVYGATGGLGLAFCEQLLAREDVAQVWACARHADDHAGLERLARQHPGRLQRVAVAGLDEPALAALATRLTASFPRLDLLLCAAGLLQGAQARAEKSLAQVEQAGLQESYLVNAVLPLLLIKHLTPLLKGHHPCQVATLSARVGSIGDNRLGGWYGYRMAKAALNQGLRCASIELARLNPESCVLALHPGTTDTALSRPFQARVPADKLFTPDHAAARLLEVLAARTPADTGSFWDWAGQPVEW
ncbi:SDR family NAD(P)-dependent oxidoreductase [Pseudomonas sp. EpS/L25]|uniref:SDR family NAD(P)-dependent oxidoreductase n=1 Tax=Pseudomonas sp. EpS/L25 TaxID=1749078 RepID=UPI000743978B|nr:SDR family NAD(P)-dependent oxidoreductase [Pseudomonas sp. EpS/L25]KUM39618.1 C-factor [Pseudomonas sp. EpS/L25]